MIRNLKNLLLLSLVTLPLAGCFLPPVISLASLALDIGSFAATGKTVADHGISAAAQEDCALLRVFDGGICRPYEDYEDDVSLAALEPLTPLGETSHLPGDAHDGDLLAGLGYIEAGLSARPGPGGVQVAATDSAQRSGARLIGANDDPASGLSPLY